MNSTINKYIDYGVWHSVTDAGRDYPAWKAITKSVGYSVERSVWNSVEHSVDNSVRNSVGESVRDSAKDYFKQNE
jgi:hypothetical protein